MNKGTTRRTSLGRSRSWAAICSSALIWACTPADPKSNDAPQTHATRLNINSRGITSFAAGAGSKQSANYRAHLVIGPEMPVAQGTSANYRALLGPIIPASGDIQDEVQVFGQPEHATYRFEASSAADWNLKLYRGVCSATDRKLLYERTAAGQTVITGTWDGLMPATSYCWIAESLGFTGTQTKMSEFQTSPAVAITQATFAQAAAPNHFDLVAAATFSGAADQSSVGWSQVLGNGSGDLNCQEFEPSLEFGAGKKAIIPGDLLPAEDFSIEQWLRKKNEDWGSGNFPILTARSNSPDNSTSGGGYAAPGLRLRWTNGGVSACLWTDQTNVCTDRVVTGATDRDWLQVVYRYSGASHAIFVNGVRIGSSNRRGNVRGNHDICLGACGSVENGHFSSGTTFELGKLVIYDQAMSTSIIRNTYDDGSGRWSETYRLSHQLAHWNFNEASGVQNFYDLRGKWAGYLGGSHSASSDDPGRQPSFTRNRATGAGSSIATRFNCQSGCIPYGPDANTTPTELTGGPRYCQRTVARIGGVWAAARPIRADRRIDSQVPTITATPLNVVAECDRPGEARVTIADQSASDNFTTNPHIEAHLSSQTGNVITFPRNFSMGSTEIHWRARDDWGNLGWTTPPMSIRVRDTTSPAATPGPALVVEAISPDGTAYSPQLQSSSDICDNSLDVTYTPQGPYSLGDTIVAFTVSDDAQNVATANRTVRVVDTTDPVFDPPLATILLGHPGSSVPCLEFTPPTPTARDNGYRPSDITVTGAWVSGPGFPNCYNLGDHTYRWTARDPSGNSVTTDQTIRVQSGTIEVRYLGLTVAGISQPTPGQFFKAHVVMGFELSGGLGQYAVTVTPAPTSIAVNGSRYDLRYESEGSYPQILIQARDQNGTGPNVGSNAFEGFAIDMTGPIVNLDVDLGNGQSCVGCIWPELNQAGVDPADASTAPFLPTGENLHFEKTYVSDGQVGLPNLKSGLKFEPGANTVQCVSVPAPNQAPLPSPACSDGKIPLGVVGAAARDIFNGYTVEMWVKPEVLAHQTFFAVPNGSNQGGASAMELFSTPDGRVCFGGYVEDARNSNNCTQLSASPSTIVQTRRGVLRPRTWHHIAATWDWNLGVVRLYVDGTPRSFKRDTDLYTAGSGLKLCDAVMGGGGVTAMFLGAHLNADGQTPSHQFQGTMGQFQFSMKPLSADEIRSHYRGGIGKPLPDSDYSFARYELDGESTAQFGLQSVVDTNTGLCGTNESCAWRSPVSGFLGSTIASDPGDPSRVDCGHPADGAASGIEELRVSIVNRDGGGETLLSVTSTLAHGTPIKSAYRAIGGVTCTVAGGICTQGSGELWVSRLAAWTSGSGPGRFYLKIVATDAAGNSTTRLLAFNILDYPGALQKAIDSLDILIPQASVSELEDARLSFAVAKSYYGLSRRYEDGSFLRASQGLRYLEDADNNGANTASISSYLSRALKGTAYKYHRDLGQGQLTTQGRSLWNVADQSFQDASFESVGGMNRPQQQVTYTRKGYDDLAMLFPRYRTMQAQLAQTRARWQSGLNNFSGGQTSATNLRTDISRVISLRGALGETRDMLRETLYMQITGILANPFTSQRQTLVEIQDVLDKSNSNDQSEAGDLIAITDQSVDDACLDRLGSLTLNDDRLFTLCYLRLNDLAIYLDNVSEPLIHTYRMRAGLALALFGMLETSLYFGPTGLPWVTSGQPHTGAGSEVLVLPDAEAANVTGAVALSTVDLSDGALARAYQKYNEARVKLDSGDVNGAWRLFVDERCLLLRAYNRYYSTDNTIPNPADPKEPPIDPATVNCP